MRKVLVIDNYDSFTYNLVQYIGELGVRPVVHRNDAIDLEAVRALSPDGIVLSPGPGRPDNERDFGICTAILREISPGVPTLGVCLGHQGVAAAYGGRVAQAEALFHGKASRVFHDGRGVFRNIPNGFQAARYHSLAIDRDSVPEGVEISATTGEGEIMGVRHTEFPIEGVQFHPESILTEYGKELLGNFLKFRPIAFARGAWQVSAP